MSEQKWNYKIVPINPSKLLTDPFYQRSIKASHMKNIVRDFDENCVNFPRVSQRTDGSYYVIDGDHTVRAWFTKHGDTPIPCIVYEGLTREQEAQMFLKLNGATFSKIVKATERLNTMLNLKDPDMVDMAETAELCGVKLNFMTGGSHRNASTCYAPDAMYKVYKAYGRETLTDVLQTIIAAWNGQKESLQSGFIQGMAVFYHEYGGKFEKKALIRALQRQTPDYYIREARGFAGNVGMKYSKVFLREYNYNRSKNRIE